MPVTIQDEKSWVLDIITCRTQNRKATAQFSMSRGMFEWIVRECLCGNTLIWKKKFKAKERSRKQFKSHCKKNSCGRTMHTNWAVKLREMTSLSAKSQDVELEWVGIEFNQRFNSLVRFYFRRAVDWNCNSQGFRYIIKLWKWMYKSCKKCSAIICTVKRQSQFH